MAAAAYSPQYAAIDSGEAQAQSNYNVAKQVVTGLYDKMGVHIADNTTAQNANYDTNKAASATNATNAQNAINSTYTMAQNQVGDLLQKLGAGSAAAAAVLPQGAADQAKAVATSANLGQAQANSLDTQKQAFDTSQTGMSQANDVNQTAAVGDLGNQLANVNNQWENQRLNLAGSQSQEALGLGTQLSNQDLQLQQLNYGAAQDTYNNQVAAINAANALAQTGYQNQITGQSAAAQAQAAGIAAALDAAKFQYGIQSDTNSLDEKKREFDATYGLDTQKAAASNTTDLARIGIEKQIADQGAGKNITDPTAKWMNNIGINLQSSGLDPNQAQAYASLIQSLATQYSDKINNPRQFQAMIAAAADQMGLNASIAMAAAADYYNSPLGTGWPQTSSQVSSAGG
jgi:hypothetical protein